MLPRRSRRLATTARDPGAAAAQARDVDHQLQEIINFLPTAAEVANARFDQLGSDNQNLDGLYQMLSGGNDQPLGPGPTNLLDNNAIAAAAALRANVNADAAEIPVVRVETPIPPELDLPIDLRSPGGSVVGIENNLDFPSSPEILPLEEVVAAVEIEEIEADEELGVAAWRGRETPFVHYLDSSSGDDDSFGSGSRDGDFRDRAARYADSSDDEVRGGNAFVGDARDDDSSDGDSSDGDASDAGDGDDRDGDARDGDARDDNARDDNARDDNARDGDARDDDARDDDARDGEARNEAARVREARNNDNNDTEVRPPPPKRIPVLRTTASPAAKRRRLLEDPTAKELEEGFTCSICLDEWEIDGGHNLISLRCGHLFGDSCIRRWLRESSSDENSGDCPQCKDKVIIRDIRPLFARRVFSLDRSEENRLRANLDAERAQVLVMGAQMASTKITQTLMEHRLKKLEAENKELREQLRILIGERRLPQKKYKLCTEKTMCVADSDGCRVMVYSPQQTQLYVAAPMQLSLFPGYGVRGVDMLTFRLCETIRVCAKPVRDISFGENLIGTASREMSSPMIDTRTCRIVHSFNPAKKAIWSCELVSSGQFYLGDSSGTTYLYDLRKPMLVVADYVTPTDTSPIINIINLPPNDTFPHGGFLVCKLQSVWLYEYDESKLNAAPTKLTVDGPFVSMHLNEASQTLLLATRGVTRTLMNEIESDRIPEGALIIGTLIKVEGIPYLDETVRFSRPNAPQITRSTQFVAEDNHFIVGYNQNEENVTLYDVNQRIRMHALPMTNVVYDMCPIYGENDMLMASLTATTLRLHRIMEALP